MERLNITASTVEFLSNENHWDCGLLAFSAECLRKGILEFEMEEEEETATEKEKKRGEEGKEGRREGRKEGRKGGREGRKGGRGREGKGE